MLRRQPRSTLTDPLFPYTTLFRSEAVPVSDAALGEFPYFSLPAGYEPMNRPVQMDYARFPFWTGEGFEWVEGRSYETSIAAADGKTWSEFELRKNLEIGRAHV